MFCFDDGGIDAQAPPFDDPSLPPARHQLGQQILEDQFVEQVRQADQGLGVWGALAVDTAEGTVDQAPSHLPLALIEAPVVQMLEHQHPEHDVGRCPQSATALAVGMALRQRRRDAIDQDLVVGGVCRYVAVSDPRAYRCQAGALPRGYVAGTLAAPWRLQ
jgi:hypothetical protein